MHRDAESIFATVEKNERRADTKRGVEQPNQQSPTDRCATEKGGETESKSQHRFTAADERHHRQYQQQKRRSNHLFFDKVTTGAALLVRLSQFVHDLEFKTVPSKIHTYIAH